jgi:ubiquinone/menaquinone biosynthesis C-methylase UbiE
MQEYARASAAAAGLAPGQLELVVAGAEAMPFPDGAFDGAVITLVLCSVPDPVAALSEVRRVVRPGGKVCVIEHVAAPASRPLLAFGQRVFEPLQRALADGCHLTRDTRAAFAKAQFDTSQLESFEVEGLSILAPHLAGVVTV